MTSGLPCHCLDYSQQVFGAVRKLTQQQSQMSFAFLAFGHIDRRAGQSNDLTRFVSEGFYM